MIHLDRLNAGTEEEFVAALGDIFEHSPWIAGRAFAARPFATVSALHEAMMAAVGAASPEEKLALLRAHPELGSKIARAGEMAAASRQEQGALGLDRLGDVEFRIFDALNREYGKRFDFPFIIAVARHTRASIRWQLEHRLRNDREAELAAALREIGYITRLRLVAAVDGPGKPKTDGRLSTHVLNTVTGKPAGGLKVVLKEVGVAISPLKEAITNADGRTDAPLIGGAPLRVGLYEIEFHVGAYFKREEIAAADPPFLDIVPVRFSIAEPEGHYHVPLLASPWSYSTYRGS
jgi:2-oxo-4-hydroxy-4-carboxy-5-ureidoimidazoline decarboxylase